MGEGGLKDCTRDREGVAVGDVIADTPTTASARRHVPLGVGAFIVFAGLCLASMVISPIVATAVFTLGGTGLAVVAARAPRSSVRRYWWAGAALGIFAVLIFYCTSALIHLEPSQVSDSG